MQTQNTLYTMKIIDPADNKVVINSNGRHITEETEGFVGGSSLSGTGTMMKMGGIAIGLRLVLFVEKAEKSGEMLLSSTKEVRVNGIRMLPSEKVIPLPK